MFRAPLIRFLCAAALTAGLLLSAVAAGKPAGAAGPGPDTGHFDVKTASTDRGTCVGSALTFFRAVVTSSCKE